jgi:predicted DNA-binding protein YlxM (UPF0122 family)
MTIGTWNIERAGSITTVLKELSKYSYKLELVGEQEVRWHLNQQTNTHFSKKGE